MTRYSLPLSLIFGLILPVVSHAVPEDSHSALIGSDVLPYLEAHAKKGEMIARDGTKLRYLSLVGLDTANSTPPTLVILGGRNENFEKYAELIFDLRELGWDLYTLDHRGQGFSEHLVPENPMIGHVNHYDDFVSDLDQFMEKVVNIRPHSRRVVLTHSMGGAIAALYLLKRPAAFDHAIWISPMFEVLFPALLSEKMAYRIASQVCDSDRVGCKSKALGGMFENWNTHYKLNQLTHSKARFKRTMAVFDANPGVYLGAPSYGWIRASIDADREIRARAAELQTPITLLQADRDRVVRNRAQTAVCAQAKNCRLISVPDARHEILMETDAIRDGALGEIRSVLVQGK